MGIRPIGRTPRGAGKEGSSIRDSAPESCLDSALRSNTTYRGPQVSTTFAGVGRLEVVGS